ncbi:MAG: hypothetical protein ACRD37_07695, partial [Candidatus Acidiferrales bacterium]
MSAFTGQGAVFDVQFGVVVGTREKLQESVVEESMHSRPAFSLRDGVRFAKPKRSCVQRKCSILRHGV